MNEIRPIPPFKRFCGMLGAFPEAFSDSMTVYEALEWLYRYIDTEIVPKTNESIKLAEELKEYVEHYFDNLDVQEEINNKLDAMVEDGTLAEIINQEIFDELNNKIDGVASDVEDIDVKLKTKSRNIQLKPMMYVDNIGGAQGICYNNNVLYVYRTDGSIQLINYNSATLGTVTSNIPFGHGNDLVFLNNKIYSADAIDTNDDFSKDISVYDLSSGTVSTIGALESESINYVSCITSIDNDNLLVLGTTSSTNRAPFNTLKLYKLKLSTSEVTQIPISNPNGYDLSYYIYTQSMEYIDGMLFIQTSYCNTLIKLIVDGNTAKVSEIFELGNYDIFGQAFGEFEGITKKGKNLILSSRVNLGSSASGNKTLNVYEFSPYTNLSSLKFGRAEPTTNNYRVNIFVDSASTTMYEDGSEDYPFRTLSRGIAAVCNSDIYKITRGIKIAAGNYSLIGSISESHFFTIEPTDPDHKPTINMNESVLIGCNFKIFDCNVTYTENSNISTSNVSFIDCNITLDAKLDIEKGSKVEILNGTLEVNFDRALRPIHFSTLMIGGDITISGSESIIGRIASSGIGVIHKPLEELFDNSSTAFIITNTAS